MHMYAYYRRVEFEWDGAKAARNLRLHGVSFDEARTTFNDPLALMHADEEHSNGEARFMLLGMSREGRLLMTVFSGRGERIRIISSRRATRREVKGYEKGI